MTTSITAVDATNIRPGTTGTVALDKELTMAYLAITQGTLYITTAKGFDNSDAAGVDTCFAPWAFAAPQRQMRLSKGKSTLGVPMTAAAGTPSATMGISRTAGTSLVLVGEATSTSTKTDNVIFEFNLPDTYVAGAAIPVVVNANYTGSGTVTAATLTLKTELEALNGTETLENTTAAQTFTGTAADYTFVAVTAAQAAAAALVAGSRVVLSITMVATTSAGAMTGQINSVRYVA